MHIPDAVRTLEQDLRRLFGDRLQSLIVYRAADASVDPDVATLAVVEGLSADDLRGCAARAGSWHEAGLATPLLLAPREFGRSLDAFPFEFGAILAEHALVCGDDPFAGLRVDPVHLRHACEVQARSHLLHLREGFVEAQGRGDAIAELVLRSVGPLAALLQNVARLRGAEGLDAAGAAREVEQAAALPAGRLERVVALTAARPLPGDAARQLFAPYLESVEALVHYIDRWSVDGRRA
jgi:hypothetical protein